MDAEESASVKPQIFAALLPGNIYLT